MFWHKGGVSFLLGSNKWRCAVHSFAGGLTRGDAGTSVEAHAGLECPLSTRRCAGEYTVVSKLHT